MFERKSMEQIVTSMMEWTRGTTRRITDFRVGSKARTLYEAVGVVVEELYDRVFRAMRKTIEENLYAVVGFDKLPATYASGTVTLARHTPAEQDYFIAAGTEVLSKATEYVKPLKYRTVADALIQTGTTSVDVVVVANAPGAEGNVDAGDINDFVQKPVGVDFVTNPTATRGGEDEETKGAQKRRFQLFMEANARGVIQAVSYGASLVRLTSEDGILTERVKEAKAFEYLPERKGEVDVYVWNGIGDASEALKAEVSRVLAGYYEGGTPVYGYKPAGVIAYVYTAPMRYVTLKLKITPESWASEAELQTQVETTVDAFFGGMGMGTGLIQTALEAEISGIEGVRDVKLHLSEDGGETFHTDNVDVSPQTVILAKKPLRFE